MPRGDLLFIILDFLFLLLFCDLVPFTSLSSSSSTLILSLSIDHNELSSLSPSSASKCFSIKYVHENGSIIFRKDCCCRRRPINRGGVVFIRPSPYFCHSIFWGDRSVIRPMRMRWTLTLCFGVDPKMKALKSIFLVATSNETTVPSADSQHR